MLVIGVIMFVLIVVSYRFGWSDFWSCYLPLALGFLGGALWNIQDIIDKYGRAWKETKGGESCLTYTQERKTDKKEF